MEAEKKGGDHHLHAVWLAAGTAVAVACLQRAPVVSLVEQWRMWVFLALNLLLLAILFTSTCTPPSASAGGQEGNINHAAGEERKLNERKKRRKQSKSVAATATDHEGGTDQLKLAKTSRNREAEKREVMVVEEDDDGAKPKAMSLSLSQEELNERVEAFIAMFRQQLISDAKAKNQSPASAQGKPILRVRKS